MGGVVLGIFYGSILFCVIASIVRVVKYVNAPLHLRWELYRGSSVYELSDWWTKTHVSFKEKLISVAKDIFLLREYYHRNRGFWYFLFPFHIGLYLLILWHAWLFIGAVTIDIETAPFWGLVWGGVAAALVFVGGAGILIKRITDEKLKVYYPPIHYLKWVFVLVTLVGGFYAVQFYYGASMPAVMGYVKGQLAFEWEHKLNPPLFSALHVLFVVPWLIYIPFSHMMQLFFRYYHELRWDHVPNLRGSDIERRVKKLLNQPIGWSAPHIQSGKSWGEVAQGMPEDTSGKEK